jgi:Skp family chaperone for outer membrane proteins
LYIDLGLLGLLKEAMEFVEKQRIIRRICSGTLYGIVSFQENEYPVTFKDPSLNLSTQADWIYKKMYDKLEDQGALTLEQSYGILKMEGKWSDDLENELTGIQKDLENLNKNLEKVKFNKTEQRAIKATIEKGKKRLGELYNIKNQLALSTIEYIANRNRQRFLIANIVQLEHSELLDVPAFKDSLIVYYFEESSISESQLRKIARTDPWRLYWTTSKDTGTPLFPHSSVEMTDLQYMLVLWTRVYDFAFSSTNRPAENVIDDDDRFDAWYQSEVTRVNEEINKASFDQGSNIGSGGIEHFIPADQEGAAEVYALNNLESRSRILQRQKAVEKEGQVKEANLPDVKRDIQMELNKMAVEGAQNRSS